MQSQQVQQEQLGATLPSSTDLVTSPSGQAGANFRDSMGMSTLSVQQSRPQSVNVIPEEVAPVNVSQSSNVGSTHAKVDYTHLYALQSEFETYMTKQQNEDLQRGNQISNRPLLPFQNSSNEEANVYNPNHDKNTHASSNSNYRHDGTYRLETDNDAEMKRLESIVHSQAIKVGYHALNSYNESTVRENSALNDLKNSYIQASVDAEAVKAQEADINATKAKSKALENGEIYVLVNRNHTTVPKYARVVPNVKTDKISQSSKQRAEYGIKAVQQGLNSVSKVMPDSFYGPMGSTAGTLQTNHVGMYNGGRERKMLLREAGVRTQDQQASLEDKSNLQEINLTTPLHVIQLDNEEPLVYRVALDRREHFPGQQDGAQMIKQSKSEMVDSLTHSMSLPRMAVSSAYVVSNTANNGVIFKDTNPSHVSLSTNNSQANMKSNSNAQSNSNLTAPYNDKLAQQNSNIMQNNNNNPANFKYDLDKRKYSTQSTRRQLRSIKEQQQQQLRNDAALYEHENIHTYTEALRTKKVNTDILLTEVSIGGYKPRQGVFHHHKNPYYLDYRKAESPTKQ